MEDDFALRYARIYPGVNSRAELVTLAPGLRPKLVQSLIPASETSHLYQLRLKCNE